MAKKRMFSMEVVDTDEFLDLSVNAQALYFHLGMHADDDGFVANPRRIMRVIGCRMRDMEALASAGFIIPFDSGVIAIRDWRINNDLRNDRYHETIYTEEKYSLCLDDARRYMLLSKLDTSRFRSGSRLETERSLA